MPGTPPAFSSGFRLWVHKSNAGLGWSSVWYWASWPASFLMPLQLQTVESRDLVWYVVSVASYGEWSKQFQQTLSYLGFTNHPPSCCLPSQLCLEQQKCSTSARQQIFWKLFLKNGSICISAASLCIFASQKETKVLSEALHEMKEENKLLKQKNASMIRKNEHYECEISRLNKVWTRVSHWPGPLPLILGSVLSSNDTTRCPSLMGEQPVNGSKLMITIGSWGNKKELTLANTGAAVLGR